MEDAHDVFYKFYRAVTQRGDKWQWKWFIFHMTQAYYLLSCILYGHGFRSKYSDS